jgi:hypothetical protein
MMRKVLMQRILPGRKQHVVQTVESGHRPGKRTMIPDRLVDRACERSSGATVILDRRILSNSRRAELSVGDHPWPPQ